MFHELDTDHRKRVFGDARDERCKEIVANRSEHQHGPQMQNHGGGRHRGSKHGRTNMTEEDVREIKRRYFNTDVLQRELAEEHGVHTDTIGKIVRGQTWQHVGA